MFFSFLIIPSLCSLISNQLLLCFLADMIFRFSVAGIFPPAAFSKVLKLFFSVTSVLSLCLPRLKVLYFLLQFFWFFFAFLPLPLHDFLYLPKAVCPGNSCILHCNRISRFSWVFCMCVCSWKFMLTKDLSCLVEHDCRSMYQYIVGNNHCLVSSIPSQNVFLEKEYKSSS